MSNQLAVPFEVAENIRRSDALFQSLGFTERQSFIMACAHHDRNDLGALASAEELEHNRYLARQMAAELAAVEAAEAAGAARAAEEETAMQQQ
jgi:hypothetical protein